MPKRKRRNGKSFTKRRKTTRGITRAEALAIVNSRVGGFIGVENKFFDQDSVAEPLSTAWAPRNPATSASLTAVAVGNTESTRIGRKYTIDALYVKGEITTVASEGNVAPPPDFRARIVIYWDTQTNESEATATDIMLSNDVLSYRNLQHSTRFIVLYDKTLQFDVTSSTTNEGAINLYAVGAMEKTFSMYKKFKKGIEVTCDGTTAVVGSITDNNCGLLAMVTDSTLTPTLFYKVRLRFRG